MARGDSMKSKRIIPVNIINIMVIVMIMATIAMLTHNIIEELTLKDIRNVARLAQTNIYAELNQELVEPVNTSLIMAQNTFLYASMNQDTQDTEDRIAEYLSAIQKVTGYESVFLVPHGTLSYYHPGGTDSKVDLSSDTSFWYRKRIEATDDYEIIVNTEQLDDFALTAYIDANIKSRRGEFAGVTGVGVRLTHLQDILSSYVNNQGVEAYLVKSDGEIQIHSDSKFIRNVNFYDIEDIRRNDFSFSSNQLDYHEKQIGHKFIISQYIPVFDWYLVVTKSTSELTSDLNAYNNKLLIILGVAMLIMLLITSVTIDRYKRQIIDISNTDQLTGIPNRTIFDRDLEAAIHNRLRQVFTLALFDIDNLKAINDEQGHDQGDLALRAVTRVARTCIPTTYSVTRIGGDEFAVIIHKPLKEAMDILMVFHKSVQNDGELNRVKATVSIGVAESNVNDLASTIYKRADQALYHSKDTGKNKIRQAIILE